MELRELLQNITPPDEAAREQAHRRWAACAKPLGSLGLLETALEDIAALTGDAQAPLLPRAVLVLCADNGVVAQGVTQTGQQRDGRCDAQPGCGAHLRVPDGAGRAVRRGARGHGRAGFCAAARRAGPAHRQRHGGYHTGACHDAGPGGAGRFGGRGALCARRRKRACVCWPRARWASATPPRPALWPACCWAARPWK